MQSLHNINLVYKVAIAMVVASLLSVGGQGYFMSGSINDIIEDSEYTELNNHYKSVIAAINAEALRAEAMSQLVANIPQASDAFANGDRDALFAMFGSGFGKLKKEYGVRQFQFHQPPATSFARIHKPQKFGDDLSSFRKTVVATNGDKKPIVGLEKGVAGLGVRGVVPVFNEGAHIGSVEFGMSFGSSFFEFYKKNNGVDVALYIQRDGAFKSFASTRGDKPLVADVDMKDVISGTPFKQVVNAGDLHKAVLYNVVNDYSGNPIGVLEVVMDSTGYYGLLQDAQYRSIVVGVVITLISLVIAVFVARSISKPISTMSHALQDISQRNFDVSLPDSNRTDEVGAMSGALEKVRDMAKNMDEMERTQNQRIDELKVWEEDIRDKANSQLQGIVSAAVMSNEAIISLAAVTRDISRVRQSSQAMAAGVEEMVASVNEIAGNSEVIATDAQDAENSSDDGMAKANNATQAMSEIYASVNQAVEKTDLLAKSSEQIGEIVGEIEAIAEQTNLLALNATIEAARAGEAGKGFAVVASEVKNLSNQTARATESISDRISTLRTEMTEISTSMTTGNRAVEKGREVIGELYAKLEEMNGQVNRVTSKIAEIANILTQQTSAANELSESTSRIAELATHNDTQVQDVLDAIDASSQEMDRRVEEFSALSNKASILQIAKNDHIAFKRRIVNTVMGRRDHKHSEMPDHHHCRLGKWYDNVDDPFLLEHPLFIAMKEPHKAVHHYGIEALKAHEQHDNDLATEYLEKLSTASNEVLELLEKVFQDYAKVA